MFYEANKLGAKQWAHYVAFAFLKNVRASKSSKTQNQSNDHSGTCNPTIEGNLAEQSPSALNNQGKSRTN